MLQAVGAMKGVLLQTGAANIIININANMIHAPPHCKLLQIFLLLTFYISTCAAESQHFKQQPESLTVKAGDLVRHSSVATIIQQSY